MANPTPEQVIAYGNLSIQDLGGKNPNIKMNDIYDDRILQYLAQYEHFTDEELTQYNQEWMEAGNPISYTDEMENALDKIYSIAAPLDDPPVPEQITQHPAFYDGKVPTDPDEITRRIEEYNKAITSADQIDQFKGKGFTVTSPTFPSGAINTYTRQLELAAAGVPYDIGAPMGERFRASLIPRSDPVGAIRKIATAATDREEGRDLLGYTLPNAEHLYPGRPLGQQGPVIRYERNVDTGEIEARFPFNEPGITGGDWAHFVLREVPAVAGDIAASLATSAVFKARLPYYKSVPTKLKEWGLFAAASGLGTSASDLTRYAVGAAAGYNDADFSEAFSEALLIGAYATAGAGAATAIMAGARGTWNFFTGKNPPDFVVERLIAMRRRFQKQLKAENISPGSPEAKALFDETVGSAPTEIQKRMKEVTGKDYTIFLGEGEIGADANFALGMLNMMRREGFDADKTMEILHDQILNNEATRLMFAKQLLLEGGNPQAAKLAVADLAKELNDDLIPKQMDLAIDDAWDTFKLQIEEGEITEQLLKELGFDDVAILGLKPAVRGLPGDLGDEVAVGENLLRKQIDPRSDLAAFRNPTISRLGFIQRQYLKPVQEQFDEIMKGYGALSQRLNVTSPLAKQVRKILQGDDASILKKDQVMRDWLFKNVDQTGYKNANQAMSRLLGRQPKGVGGAGDFGGDLVTFKELHEMRISLHEMRNQLGGKVSEPSMRTVNELITAIEQQQNIMLKKAAREQAEKLGIPLRQFTDETRIDRLYWDTMTDYSERSQLANHRFIQTLLDRSELAPAGLIDSLFAASPKGGAGSSYHPVADPFFKLLRNSTESYRNLEASGKLLKGEEVFNPEKIIRELQSGIGARYKREVIDQFADESILVRAQKRALAHEKFMLRHKGLLDAAFTSKESKQAWKNVNKSMSFMNKMTEGRAKAIEKIRKEFDFLPEDDFETAVLNILRGTTDEKAAGAMNKRYKLAKIVKDSGDPELVELMNSVVLKDIHNQIVVRDPMGGLTGKLTIDPDKFNDLLTKGYVLGTGEGEVISFRRFFGPFLTKGQITDLKLLNNAVQSNARLERTSGEVIESVIGLVQKGETPPEKLGRMIFGPLNKYTYRIGQRGRTLKTKTFDLMQEALVKPEILDKLAAQMNKKQTINQAIRFFMSLDSVIAHDIGRDLQSAKDQDEELTFSDRYGDESVFASPEYFNYFQDFFTNPNSKIRPRGSGFIREGETLEYLPIQVPVAVGSGLWSAGKSIGRAVSTPPPQDVGSIAEVIP
tara:strand:- start:155 stop:3979 length:3825 start_codon:yes stop_codon:yes gene_type:complete